MPMPFDAIMNKKILICGINGYLGAAMARYLRRLRNGPIVYGIARRASKYGNAAIFACDLNQTSRLKNILRDIRPDIIFHFAGGRLGDDRKTFDANFTTTKNLLETLKRLGLTNKPRVIVPGSAAEYGNIQGQGLIAEHCLPRPLGWYGFVKLLQTDLGLFFARQGLDVIVARMYNI